MVDKILQERNVAELEIASTMMTTYRRRPAV
jgi:hypothetical protein